MIDLSNLVPQDGTKKDIQMMAVFGVVTVLVIASLIIENWKSITMWIVLAVCVTGFIVNLKEYIKDKKKEQNSGEK